MFFFVVIVAVVVIGLFVFGFNSLNKTVKEETFVLF